MQAAARLRQLAKAQSLIIAAPADVCTSIIEVCHLQDGDAIQPKHVLHWVLWNTARANAKVTSLRLWNGSLLSELSHLNL